jgi:hypothetical protein
LPQIEMGKAASEKNSIIPSRNADSIPADRISSRPLQPIQTGQACMDAAVVWIHQTIAIRACGDRSLQGLVAGQGQFERLFVGPDRLLATTLLDQNLP